MSVAVKLLLHGCAVRALFSPALRADPALAAARHRANEAARAALGRFYTVLVRIDGLDESLRALLNGFRQQVVDRLRDAP